VSLGLYLHVPFCQSICGYCNFNRGVFDRSLATRFVEAIAVEIERAGTGASADTIFFGGGTPSVLEPAEIGRLIASCRRAFTVTGDVEITLETNPESVSVERMHGWRDAGVTRISLGAQSFDDAELRRLDRAHRATRIDEAVAAARDASFANISLDLMCWLPGQSLVSWRRTLQRAMALEPDHLSLYLLELYPGSPLREAMARSSALGSGAEAERTGWLQTPDDEAADMYLEAFETLEAAGLQQYEISNAARANRTSRHNLKYWSAGSWIGFGPGAHSTADESRWQNIAATDAYIDRVSAGQPVDTGRRQIAADERAQEALFTGLRLTSGIDRAAFEARFGFDPWLRHAGVFAGPLADRLMWQAGPAFGLTRAGMLVSNEIAQLVISPLQD
jgi:oxygen-independent coproporphyrinogen-3 oxidase